jgi:hypothetical protein
MTAESPQDPFSVRNNSVRIIFEGDEAITTPLYRAFNPNDFAPSLKIGITHCIARYRAVLVYANNTVREIRHYRTTHVFIQDLANINHNVPIQWQVIGFTELYSPNIRSNFESLLMASKSLLDVLCKYLLGLIGPKIDGFHKKDNVVGGKVLRVLQRNVPQQHMAIASDLIQLIEEHKILWIDDLVKMRDVVSHHGDLEGLIGFWLVIEPGRVIPFTPDDINEPIVRIKGTTQDLAAYCNNLLPLIEDFVIRFRNILFALSSP